MNAAIVIDQDVVRVPVRQAPVVVLVRGRAVPWAPMADLEEGELPPFALPSPPPSGEVQG